MDGAEQVVALPERRLVDAVLRGVHVRRGLGGQVNGQRRRRSRHRPDCGDTARAKSVQRP